MTEAGSGHKKARSKNKTTASGPKSLPGWLWLVSGVVIGGFFSFIVYLKLNVPIEVIDAKNEHVILEKRPIKTESENSALKSPEKEKFEFYKILPNREVVLPESVNNTQEEKTNKLTNESHNASKNVKAEPVSKAVSYVYTLQVGSFLAFKDADKRKANLAMLGIGSRIHSIKTNNRTHYRVIVGPYEDIKRVNEIDTSMKANNIKTLILREKG